MQCTQVAETHAQHSYTCIQPSAISHQPSAQETGQTGDRRQTADRDRDRNRNSRQASWSAAGARVPPDPSFFSFSLYWVHPTSYHLNTCIALSSDRLQTEHKHNQTIVSSSRICLFFVYSRWLGSINGSLKLICARFYIWLSHVLVEGSESRSRYKWKTADIQVR